VRGWTTLATLAALLALAGLASAHAPAVEATADEPAAAETGPLGACVPTCEVDARRTANAPPVLAVESGATVTWTSADGGQHSATSDEPAEHKPELLLDATAPLRPDACLDVTFQPGGPGQVRFEVRDDGLHALETSAFDADWQRCEEAIALPGGAWALSYHCKFHPRFQQGLLQVLPPGAGGPGDESV
jgi:plastocyanin